MIYLALILLLPVSGWAESDYQPSLQPGDTFETGDGCNTCTMQADGSTVLCTLLACLPAQREQPSCYQRMQEAMWLRHELDTDRGPEYPFDPSVNSLLHAKKLYEYELFHEKKRLKEKILEEKWKNVMTDCVEGKP